jgi:hypothetical protein
MKPECPIDAVVRREKLRVVRNWCFGLGAAIVFLAVLSLGGHGSILTNPKAWAPTGGPGFVAVNLLPGGLASLFIPLLICGAVLGFVGLLITLYIRQWH